MKKALYVLLAMSLVFVLSCKDDGGGQLSVDQVSASDLADYTDNGIDPSDTGEMELMAAMYAGMAVSGVMESWMTDENLDSYFPSAGLTRAINEPSDSEFEAMMTAFDQGGDFSISASIVDESVDFSDYGNSGTLTLNASVSADGDISDYAATSGTDTISVDAEFEIVGANLDTGTLDMPALVINMITDTTVTHTYSETSDAVSANSNSAIVLAFSLSDMDGMVASGKYIYTLAFNEQIDVDTEASEPDVNVSASISLKIYDNSDAEIASYSFNSDDMEAMFSGM